MNTDEQQPSMPAGHTVDPAIAAQVDEVINSGNVLDYLTKTVQRVVVGNEVGIKLMILVCAQRGLMNGSGVYIQIVGDSGGGKSFMTRQVLWIFPQEIVCDGSISAKALYYDGSIEPKIYYVDDFNSLDEGVKSVLKNILTNFRRPTILKTVNKINGTNAVDCKIVPPRTVVIFSAVDSIGDQQLMSRLIPLPVDSGEHVAQAIHECQNLMAAGLREDLDAVVDERVEVCREIIRALTSKTVEVVIPYAPEIMWPDELKSRNYNVFLDLIKMHTLLHQRQREVDEHSRIIANYADFHEAAMIYAPRRKMQATKLSEQPQRILDFLREHNNENFTQGELVARLKVTQSAISKGIMTLKEMSMVVEDKGIREHGTKSMTMNVYQYRGEKIRSTVFDSPIQLSEAERSKPEYKAYKESRV